MSGKVNINVGVLGHVDSGKTSLCKTMSTTGSTAAFDSNPQSRERGITLDLGFSSFSMESSQNFNFTLIDCPGHSTLIRTVIGGAQIMDIMLLIIDITKGLQPQAGECLILAQITSSHLIVVLNKVDLVPPDARTSKIEKVKKLMRSTLSKTKFGNAPVVSVSAVDPSIGTLELQAELLEKVNNNTFVRQTSQPFLMAVDHCFPIKGQGTVATGTVLQGFVKVNDVVEFPSLRETKKVKSIQSFRVSVPEAKAGDRIGMCIPGLDSSAVERTVVAAPGLVLPSIRAGIVTLEKIPYFKKAIVSKKKYHLSIAYETVTARVTLFRSNQGASFDPNTEYEYVEEFEKNVEESSKHTDRVGKDSLENAIPTVFALVEFDMPVLALPDTLIIGSDLQSEEENACRLAFHGRLVDFTQDKHYASTYLPSVKIFKEKSKEGSLDRIVSEYQLIAKGFCKKESNIDHLVGLKVKVILPDSNELNLGARIESRFGQTNKVRLSLVEAMSSDDMKLLKSNVKQAKVLLNFKKYFFVGSKKLVQ